jgi:peptidoglycan/xylan/chitin deacetylase (PgdA/CDA1 family)
LTTRPARISILMYHQVGRFEPMRAHRANYCDAGRFARQMGLLARGGFNVIDLDTALRCLRGFQPTPARAVVLTFDDGYRNFMEHAMPVLRRHGFPAAVYAISGCLGTRMRWHDADPSREKPPLMTGAELRAIATQGITIGSHGVSHAKLAECSPEQQRRELTDSRAALSDLLGSEVRHLCYPFGSFAAETVQAAAEAGYQSATTCLRGAATVEDHPLVLPRKAISFGDDLIGFWWKLAVKHAPKPALVRWRREMGDDLARAGHHG